MRWREHTVSGAGDWTQLFDGSGLFHWEAGEYTRKKLAQDNDAPEPDAYDQTSVDLKRGIEVKHIPCGLTGVDHDCVVLDLPSKPRLGKSPDAPKVTRGSRRIVIDSKTGLLLFSQTIEDLEGRRQSYRAEVSIHRNA